MQSTGHEGDVLLQRTPRDLCNKSYENSGLHEEGILQRLLRRFVYPLMKSLSFHLLRHEGLLERIGLGRGLRGLAAPIARIVLSPELNAFDIVGASEVVLVFGFL